MTYRLPPRPVTSVEMFLNGLLEEIKGLRMDLKNQNETQPPPEDPVIEVHSPTLEELLEGEEDEVLDVQEPLPLKKAPGKKSKKGS